MKINFILMKGVVIKSTGSLCQVLSDNKKQYSCKLKGRTRLLDLDFTNPITLTGGPVNGTAIKGTIFSVTDDF